MIEIVSVLLISLILSLFFGTIWLRLGRIWGFTEKVFSRPNIRLTALRASYDSKRNTVTMGGNRHSAQYIHHKHFLGRV